MGSNLGKSSADLHKEADEASSPPAPHVSEVINPARRLARQEAEAGLPQTDTRRVSPAPAPAPAPTMSQTDFARSSGKPRSEPPADMLKRHQNR